MKLYTYGIWKIQVKNIAHPVGIRHIYGIGASAGIGMFRDIKIAFGIILKDFAFSQGPIDTINGLGLTIAPG